MSQNETPSFEAALKQLEEIVARLEKGELPLEESLALYQEGIRLARLCHGKLEEAEGKIEMLLKNARGEPELGAQGEPKTTPLSSPEADGDDVPF